ncbi:hypothetical protein Ciccas_010485 [Cichlidogyrus casuarinus]|uniref:Secreted protein n=1 Tax=Cichlidogyrus casuarinus TaxID=1844966 RepID=A0ABD2PYL5_9PLAT
MNLSASGSISMNSTRLLLPILLWAVFAGLFICAANRKIISSPMPVSWAKVRSSSNTAAMSSNRQCKRNSRPRLGQHNEHFCALAQ